MNRTSARNILACLALTGASIAIAAGSSITDLHEEDVEGKTILDSTGSVLGDADELVQNKSAQKLVVIGLEDSDKEVAVPLEKFSMSSDGENLTIDMSKAELLALPDYDPMDMESADD
jgi:glyceraldehyde-3-phosphate dehydrogenase/erythrose-4-phosphate dehydrogenase